MNLQEFGQTVKQKYPQYKDVSDEELGAKVLEKYPQYRDRVTTVATPTPAESKPNNALSSILDFVAPQTVKFTKDILNVPKAYNLAKQETQAAKEQNPNAVFFNPSPELRSLQGGSSTETGNPLLNNTLDTIAKFRTSSGAGTEIGGLASGIKGLTSWIKNDLLHPLKTTGSKLENVRKLIEVPKSESETKIFKNITEDRTYKLNPELKKEVDKGFSKLIKGTNPGKETNNLNEIYQNLNSLKEISGDAKNVLSRAVREYAKPLQTQAGLKLEKAYSTLKSLQKYEGTAKKAVVGSAAAGVIWTLRSKLVKLLGLQ
jgi:hypothetical protein